MQAPDDGKFLKGLAVVNDVAYFGVSVFAPRSARQDPEVDSELAAFDLRARRLLWRRRVRLGCEGKGGGRGWRRGWRWPDMVQAYLKESRMAGYAAWLGRQIPSNLLEVQVRKRELKGLIRFP